MIDFDGEHWATALQAGLGARVWRSPSDHGGLMACFRAGPFKVAYPDFVIGSSCLNDAVLAAYCDGASRLGADLIRLQTPASVEDRRVYARHPLGSIAIASLQDWSERGWEKARRAANRQSRSKLQIRAGRPGDGAHLHRLYLSTLHRHSGVARYSREYFEAIAPHAALVAVLDDEICGFVCTGFQGSRACYMHGAHLPQARSHYPSDQLFLSMLRTARDAGLRSFDFLPSPRGQDSLAAYKRAWGGSDISLVVSDLALNPVRARGFSWALRLSNGLAGLRRRGA
ncbi:GNAT family N-acetyltransferase [Lysobacter capsici]|uniref:GNAT family N-acetyltransferase n=1 Tax=Lysobacter capsici TaxID=435897 RepID=UPI0012FD7224|nr:GNAT family N-acetyltransferase [Lysobacter capsici]